MSWPRNIPIGWLILIIVLPAPLLCFGTYYLYLAELVVIFSIAGVGLRQFVAYTNRLAFSQGAMMAIGAYSTALISTAGAQIVSGPAGTVAALAAGALVGMFAAALLGSLLVYPALRLRGPYFAMVTIALAWIVWRIAVEWTPVTGGDLGISAVPNLAVALGLPPQAQYFLSAALLAAAILVIGRIAGSGFGMLQAAYRADPVALSALGVRADLVKLLLFILCSALGGLAGALFAMHQSYVNPNAFEIFDSVFLLIAVLIGGVRSSLGAIVGVTIIYILPEFLHGLEDYRLSFYAVLLLTVLLIARDGLLRDAGGEPWRKRLTRRSPARDAEPAARAEAPRLTVANVTKCFGSLRALDGVSLAAGGGAVEAIIGPNGSGKSTLLDTICGFVERDGGSVALDSAELPPAGLDALARLGVMRTFQTVRNLDELTCRENILVALVASRFRNRRIDILRAVFSHLSRKDEQVSSQMLREFGLGQVAEVRAANLSQGHRRLLEIARVIAASPDVLLLDEPTSGLDDREVGEVISAVRRCKARGMAVVAVDHNMKFVSAVADHVTALEAGKVIAEGSAAAVLADPAVVKAYTGSGGTNA